MSSVTPMGYPSKYKSVISTNMYPTGDLNKYKFVISTSICISLLYEFMKNYDMGFNSCRYRGGRPRSFA